MFKIDEIFITISDLRIINKPNGLNHSHMVDKNSAVSVKIVCI